MGKGGMSLDDHGEVKDGEEENLAAWLVAINTLKIQPFKLPPLGINLPQLALSLHSVFVLFLRISVYTAAKFIVKSLAYFILYLLKDPMMSELE